MGAGNKNTPSTHHPRRQDVATSMTGLKKKNGHIRINPTKNGEPRRYSWEHRRKRSPVLFYSILFYSILGCVLPLQEVALRQSPPSFSVLCYPCPYRSLLPHNVISPTPIWSSTDLAPFICQSVLLIVHLLSFTRAIRCVHPISISHWLRIGLCLSLWRWWW